VWVRSPALFHVVFYTLRYADLNAWTDAAMSLVGRELKKRGLNVRKDAPQSITMAIESAKTEDGWNNVTSRIVMTVKTSDGYTASYTGRDRAIGAAFARPLNQMDTALVRVVVLMLNDPKMVSSLTK